MVEMVMTGFNPTTFYWCNSGQIVMRTTVIKFYHNVTLHMCWSFLLFWYIDWKINKLITNINKKFYPFSIFTFGHLGPQNSLTLDLTCPIALLHTTTNVIVLDCFFLGYFENATLKEKPDLTLFEIFSIAITNVNYHLWWGFVWNVFLCRGSGCSSVGIAVTSNTRGLQYKSSHRHLLYWSFVYCQLY